MSQSMDVAPLLGYREDVGLLLASLVDSTREWRAELRNWQAEDGEPALDSIVWQPEPGSYSIGSILMHIISVELWWLLTFAAGVPGSPEEMSQLLWDETDVDQGIWPVPPAKPLSWYYELHDAVRVRAFEALKSVDPDKVYTNAEGHSRSLRWVLAHVIQHDSYHGGQAVLLHELWKKRVSSGTA